MSETADIAIIGSGAAGLMAGIFAGRAAAAAHAGSIARPKIVLLDSAKHLGAKILVAGGGRCNVTHDVVDERAFAGSSRHAIKKVLRRFDVPQTIKFFRELGVELKREETGKLFPTTDKARTVLDALLRALDQTGAELRHQWRVDSIERVNAEERASEHFVVKGVAGTLRSRIVIVATGGRSLPKTGSDGHGYEMVRSLGHTITDRIFPALVPLTLPKNHFITELSGLSAIVTLIVHSGTGKKLTSFTDSMLCTHFGISGPVALDISRYLADALANDPAAHLAINWLGVASSAEVEAALLNLGKQSVGRWLRESQDRRAGLPQRLAEALCVQAGVDPTAAANQLTREKRRALIEALTSMRLPITGNRGFVHAEVTAGGVPVSEVRLETMESRISPGLYLCGEICDVDGRIGGYNFQWAWASGFIAGTSAATAHPAKLEREMQQCPVKDSNLGPAD